MRTHRWIWALAGALLASCAGYGAPDEVVFGEAVFTQGKPDFNFSSLSPGAGVKPKYVIVKQVKVIDDPVTQTDMPESVVQTIRTNMNALGYEEVPSSNPTTAAEVDAADVALQAALLKGSAAVYYPGYWCDYWYYYSCYYDWNYAGTYKFGTLVLGMSDVRLFDPANTVPPGQPGAQRLPPLWVGAVYGVQTQAANDIARVSEGLNVAFGHSSYLAVTP